MPLKITLKPYELNNYVKLDPGQDDGTLNTMLASAILEAEQFLNTDFSTVTVNEDGTTTTTPNEAPAAVKEWIFNRVAQKYENVGAWTNPDNTPLKPYRKHPFRGL